MAKRAFPALALMAVMLAGVGPAIGQETDFDGAALFSRYCASCHGALGEGDGPVAAAMTITVPNLRTLKARANGTFPRESVMRYIDGRNLPAAHGDRLMPVWGATFAESADTSEAGNAIAKETIAAIASYIEQLQN